MKVIIEKEILILTLKNKIADKEWAIACANMETVSKGSWTCDWYKDIQNSDRELLEIIKKLDSPSDGNYKENLNF